MKTYKIFMVAALASVVLSGCKFLESNTPSTKDAKQVFSDPVLTEETVFSVYNLMASNNSYRNRIACGLAGLNTDAEWSTMAGGTNASQKALMTYNCGTSNDQISDGKGSGQEIWAYLNTMIERCNNIIEGIDEYGTPGDRPEMAYLQGEALFLRSFAYLELVKYWGDVPVRFESVAMNEDGIKNPKADRNGIYEHLRVDLRRAAELMPWSEEIPVASARNNVGRPSKAAALALLARVDLMFAGKAVRPGANGRDVYDQVNYAVVYNLEDAEARRALYAEALDACAQIIHKENFKLLPDFKTPFYQICAGITAYNQMEHIWVMPFNYGSRGQVLTYNAAKIGSDMAVATIGHLPGYARTDGKTSGHVCVSPYIFPMFEDGDKRLAVTLVPGQWEYSDGTSENSDAAARAYIFPNHAATEKKLFQKHTQINNFYCGKYRYEWYGSSGKAVENADDGVSFPVLRYADVLLMFAEAEIGGISGDVPANKTDLIGVQQFNKVRNRAGVTPVGAVTMEAIDKERALEFCGEYIRKYDLMRWGIVKERLMAVKQYIDEIKMTGYGKGHDLGDTLFYKYTYTAFPTVMNGKDTTVYGYVIDSIYGLKPGEKTRLPNMTRENGWQAKDIYSSESKGYVLQESLYPIYMEEEKLESRQYWPIFPHNLTAAGSNVLWNNYGY